MSRLDELKKQYPELNVSFFDMMTRLDTSKTYKYLPLMCKIFGQRINPKKFWHKDDYSSNLLDVQSTLINRGISTDGLNDGQMYYILNFITEHYTNDTYQTLKEFMDYMDKGQIDNKDISNYKDLDDVRGAVTLASIKEYTKDLENQIIKEYEDEKWVAVRPLTFSASAKYGSSTRWCTTYQREKQYFEKYWRNGILVYFINKQTGYKFAGFKGLNGDAEFSFWNAEDSRVDYLDVNADDYLFPIVRGIFKSDQTNKNLSSDEIQQQVHEECLSAHEKMRIEFVSQEPIEQPIEPTPNYQREMDRLDELLNETDMIHLERDLRPEVSYSEDVPTMRA